MTAHDGSSDGPGPLDRGALTLLAAAVVLLGAGIAVVQVVDHRAPTSSVVREFLFASSWIVVGTVAIWLRRGALARRILALALVLAATFAGSFGLLGSAVLPRIVVTTTALLVPLQAAFAGHLLLSYPKGVLSDPSARRLVTAGYVLGGIEGLWWALVHSSARGCPECADRLASGGLPPAAENAVSAGFALAWLILVVGFLWQLARQFRQAGPRQRRLLRLPYASIAVSACLYGLLSLVAAQEGTSVWGISKEAIIAVQVVSLLGVPACLLIGMLHERLSYKRIGELVVSLERTGDADLERSLSTALGDPSLRVVFPVEDGYVDTRGQPATRPATNAHLEVTAVGDAATPLALIAHDRSLADEPALLIVAGSATRMALENARLQAEVRAQLNEVRESRTRIVEATNEARARLERDLHDGAQQRLLAIGIALQLLHQRPGDAQLLSAAQTELADALTELRELAAGIHPAVLTDLGLLAALDALVRRLGPVVSLDRPQGQVRRLPEPVEAAAYFATAEAITNALKHADATAVVVTVAECGAVLRIQVSDDGTGGATPEGTGITGIRDRLASVDGAVTLVSPPGSGTKVMMEVPCG